MGELATSPGREGWEALFREVTPIEQDDGPVPIVKIDYAPSFVKAMGYFRHVLINEECSQRALSLSAGALKTRRPDGRARVACSVRHSRAEVIEYNAANYTAWQFRRHCLQVMHKESSAEARHAAWRHELLYSEVQCLENMKNYQVWFHRRACINALQEPAGELEFVAKVLGEDAKNYHAWGHRQWVLRTFGLWAGELEYADSLIEADPRNNSAWNQRVYVLKRTADLADAASARTPPRPLPPCGGLETMRAAGLEPKGCCAQRAPLTTSSLRARRYCCCSGGPRGGLRAHVHCARTVELVAVGISQGPRRAARLRVLSAGTQGVRGPCQGRRARAARAVRRGARATRRRAARTRARARCRPCAQRVRAAGGSRPHPRALLEVAG